MRWYLPNTQHWVTSWWGASPICSTEWHCPIVHGTSEWSDIVHSKQVPDIVHGTSEWSDIVHGKQVPQVHNLQNFREVFTRDSPCESKAGGSLLRSDWQTCCPCPPCKQATTVPEFGWWHLILAQFCPVSRVAADELWPSPDHPGCDMEWHRVHIWHWSGTLHPWQMSPAEKSRAQQLVVTCQDFLSSATKTFMKCTKLWFYKWNLLIKFGPKPEKLPLISSLVQNQIW